MSVFQRPGVTGAVATRGTPAIEHGHTFLALKANDFSALPGLQVKVLVV